MKQAVRAAAAAGARFYCALPRYCGLIRSVTDLFFSFVESSQACNAMLALAIRWQYRKLVSKPRKQECVHNIQYVCVCCAIECTALRPCLSKYPHRQAGRLYACSTQYQTHCCFMLELLLLLVSNKTSLSLCVTLNEPADL